MIKSKEELGLGDVTEGETEELIYFASARIYAREIEVKKKPIGLTSGHRGKGNCKKTVTLS